MIKDTAKKLLPCVNDPKHNEALTQYANERIDSLTRNLYRETDHCKIHILQGAIIELQRLLTLREEAQQIEQELRESNKDSKSTLSKSELPSPKKVITQLEDSVWTLSYRFSSQPKDDDNDEDCFFTIPTIIQTKETVVYAAVASLCRGKNHSVDLLEPVSYTHLTLPTILLV